MGAIEATGFGYVLFKNGYHDGVTFYDKETHGFNPDIFFSARLEFDYDEFPTDEEIAYAKDVRQRIFYNPIGNHEVGDWFILNIARALMGGGRLI